MIDDFVRNNKSRSMASFELGQALYFSLIKFCNAVLGNSSSGLLEVPSFKIPTINVGDRQKGRLKASSVIDCKAAEKSIDRALNFAFSSAFQEKITFTVNPYGDGHTSKKIISIIHNSNKLKSLKKKFHDVSFNE